MVLASAAEFHRAGRRWVEAARLFERASDAALRAGQEEVSLRLALNAGESWRKAGDAERALELFRRVEAKAAADSWLYEQAGAGVGRATLDSAERALAEGRPAEALPIYDDFLETRPGSARARHGRARARLALGELAAAEEDLRLLLDGHPSGRLAAAIWADMALAAAMRGERDEALRRLDLAQEYDPNLPAAITLRRRLER
jgi:tetratricopeptide (TPR) repeat protein